MNTEFTVITRTREEITHAGQTVASITRLPCGLHHCHIPSPAGGGKGWLKPTRKQAQTSILAAL